MNKVFNTAGDCKPEIHYMVNIEKRLGEIKKLVDRGAYFTINKARQYGKTTTLRLLAKYLLSEYVVVSLDFQGFTQRDFETEESFVSIFAHALLKRKVVSSKEVCAKLEKLVTGKNASLSTLFMYISEWCEKTTMPIVLLIDEVDSASNHQVFLDFLSLLRQYYLDRDMAPTFQSVVLAGVYDIKNLKMKIHPEHISKTNSPWNIATKFKVEMCFTAQEIEGMLCGYEADYCTGMDIGEVANMIYDYTCGYPFLVSYLCQILDEETGQEFSSKSEAWTENGLLYAVKVLLNEKNSLFESFIHKLTTYQELYEFIYVLLFKGYHIPYTATNEIINQAEMFGLVKKDKGMVVIANRIFETVLYNHILSNELIGNRMYAVAICEKNQFIQQGKLNMELILQKFIEYFEDIFGSETQLFKEDQGRKYFLLYLKPIINGIGNYYIEAQTRDMKRTDVIVDYAGKRYVIEMKIWRGEEYNKRGELQLVEYLNYYHLQQGYMLSFNFNKNKKIGMKRIELEGKVLIEAVV